RHLIGEWTPDFHAAQPRLGIEVLDVEVEYVGKGAGLAARCGRRHCQDVLRTTGKLPGGHRETAGAQVAVEFLVGLCRDFGKAMARPKWRSMYQIALVTGRHKMAPHGQPSYGALRGPSLDRRCAFGRSPQIARAWRHRPRGRRG